MHQGDGQARDARVCPLGCVCARARTLARAAAGLRLVVAGGARCGGVCGACGSVRDSWAVYMVWVRDVPWQERMLGDPMAVLDVPTVQSVDRVGKGHGVSPSP